MSHWLPPLRDPWWRRAPAGYLWLAFLIYPVSDLFTSPRPWWVRGLGLSGVAFLALFYLVVMYRWWAGRTTGIRPLAYAVAAALLAAMAVFGQGWSGVMIYAAMLVAMTSPTGRAQIWWPLGVAAAGTAITLLRGVDVGSAVLLGAIAAISGAGSYGMSRVFQLARELTAVRAEAARLAVADERARFARDLHDLLGHSLSLIVLKGELAGRLLDAGRADAARTEVADIEAVARRSLAEVRDAVSGYRRSTLAAELADAKESLRGANIRASTPAALPELAPEVELLFGWTVREGVTNVLRHSRAHRCDITITDDGDALVLEIEDDGDGADPAGTGNGLAGLCERAARIGGLCSAGPRPGGGFRLAVAVPVPVGAPA